MTFECSCVDISRVNHFLLVSSDILTGDLAALRDLKQPALEQVAFGIHAGGLGFCPASDSALVAFVGIQMEAAPLAHRIFASMEAHSLPGFAARSVYDSQLAAATERLSLSPSFCRALMLTR